MSDCSTNTWMTPEVKSWLKENRCGHCPHDCEPLTKYKVVKAHEGWRCYGYRSKYWDIPIQYKAEGEESL